VLTFKSFDYHPGPTFKDRKQFSAQTQKNNLLKQCYIVENTTDYRHTTFYKLFIKKKKKTIQAEDV
jgi:hypothetical protein